MNKLLSPIARTFQLYLFTCLFQVWAAAQPQLTYSPFISGLSVPVELKSANDGTGRLFIAEQGGKIRILKNGTVLPKPFLDISNITGYSDYQGLWSVAFAPNYRQTRAFFVLYTGINGFTELVRYQASRNNPDTALPATRSVLLSFPGDGTGGPHFGQMHFGNDGLLYLTLSDGSSPYKTETFAQNGRLPFGKMLRIDVNVPNAPFYRVPASNPYVNDPAVLDEIWCSGFRNSWRWSFDNRNDDIWIPDVGGNRAEEINVLSVAQSAGANFGWPCYESNLPYLTNGCGPVNTYRFPAFTYPNDSSWGGSCIIGGYVYRGTSFPALKGFFVCSDFISSNAWLVRQTTPGTVMAQLQQPAPAGIVSYGLDENNELYAISLTGNIYRVGATTATTAATTNAAGMLHTGVVQQAPRMYPTLVNNRQMVIELNRPYKMLQVIDMNGLSVHRQNINGITGKITIALPALTTGTYVVQLLGEQFFSQKIYVTNGE